MNQIWNYNHWFLCVLLSTRLMLWPMSYSPSFLDGRCLNVLSLKTISRVAWNFRLSFMTCKQNLLRNILTHESIKSEVIVVLQVFVVWKKITLVQGCLFLKPSHNILEQFDILSNFPSPQVKPSDNISNKNGKDELST